MKDIRDAIKEVANRGGSIKLQTTLPAEITMVQGNDYAESPSIFLHQDTENEMVTPEHLIYISGDGQPEVGPGEQTNVIELYSEPVTGGYTNQMELYFRNQTMNDNISKIYPVFTDRVMAGRRSNVEFLIQKGDNLGPEDTGGIYINKVNVTMRVR